MGSQRVRAALHRLGIEVGRFPPRHVDRRRGVLLHRLGVDVVIDVGANEGEYGAALREAGGYGGRIVSLEPGSAAFQRLASRTAGDPAWAAERMALTDIDGSMELRLDAGGADHLNSLMDYSSAGRSMGFAANQTETVRVARLDTVVERWAQPGDALFVKLDVQGAESKVLDGAAQTLPRIVGVQTELSLIPLYDGQIEALELLARLAGEGFALIDVQPGYVDHDRGVMMEFDGVLVRTEAVARF